MFSPALAAQTAPSVRSSRRRQRPLSNDGSLAPPPKRQRSALNDQTFVPPNGDKEMEQVKATTKATSSAREVSRDVQAPQREVAVRSKKSKTGDRGTKGDGSKLLVR